MQKQTKVSYLMIATFIISVIIHNLFYAIFGTEDVVFFFLGLAAFLVFVITLIYNTFTFFKKGEPKDWWKVGFLGLLGLVGIIPNFGPRFFVLYSFFAFFGLRKK